METRPAGEDKPVEPAAAALMPRSSSPVPPAELEIAVDGATGRPSTTPSADSWHHQQMFPKRIGAVACSSAWSSPRRPKDCYGRSASCEISRGWLHWSWFGLVAPAPAQQHSARYGTRFPPFSALQPRGRSRHRPYWPSAQPSCGASGPESGGGPAAGRVEDRAGTGRTERLGDCIGDQHVVTPPEIRPPVLLPFRTSRWSPRRSRAGRPRSRNAPIGWLGSRFRRGLSGERGVQAGGAMRVPLAGLRLPVGRAGRLAAGV